MAQLSFLQMYDAKDWSGLTTSNHLGSIFQSKPQKASQLVTAIHDTNFGMNLDSYLSKLGAKSMPTDDDFTWELIGSAKKNIPLVEARVAGVAITAVSQPGINGTQFELVFPEKWFTDEDLIVGHKNEKYPIKIIAPPVQEGSNWVYSVIALKSDNDFFVDPDELAPGKRFSKDWSPVEMTGSKKGGGINFTSPFGMRNSFSMVRMQHTTMGNMINRPFATVFKNSQGKVFKVWTQYEDYQFEEQFKRAKNRLLMFSTTTRGSDGVYRVKGKSGYEIKQGAGVRQQMEASGTHYYSTFSIDLFTDILMDLSEGRLPADQRKFVAGTGERGSTQFHKSIEDKTTLYTPNRTEDRFYKAGSQVPHSMGMGYGGQFVEYKAPNNITIAINVDSIYDDRERNKEYHPTSGGTLESYRYDIMDVGTTEGEANLQKLYVEGSEDIMGYEPGLRDPFSSSGNRIMANSTDGYTVHRATVCGVMQKDPSRSTSLINNLQA